MEGDDIIVLLSFEESTDGYTSWLLTTNGWSHLPILKTTRGDSGRLKEEEEGKETMVIITTCTLLATACGVPQAFYPPPNTTGGLNQLIKRAWGWMLPEAWRSPTRSPLPGPLASTGATSPCGSRAAAHRAPLGCGSRWHPIQTETMRRCSCQNTFLSRAQRWN